MPDFFVERTQKEEQTEQAVEEKSVQQKNQETIDSLVVGSQISFREGIYKGSYEVTKINGDFSIELKNLDKTSIMLGTSLVGHWKKRMLEAAGDEPIIIINAAKQLEQTPDQLRLESLIAEERTAEQTEQISTVQNPESVKLKNQISSKV